MQLEPRAARPDEMDEFTTAVHLGFGHTRPAVDDDYPDALLEAERALLVRDDDRIVATAGAYDFRVTVPGGAQVPVAGVTQVTVHPTHRRRGLLRRMMAVQLDDVARRGEPLAALTASESSIYRRFGYGAATFTTRWELDRSHAVLDPAPDTGGRVRAVTGDVAVAVARDVYDRVAAARVGELARPASWWPRLFVSTDGGMKCFTAVHDDATGAPDAFVRYALEHRSPDGVQADTLRVLELQAVDAPAEAALWSFLFGVDLVATVSARVRPVDDPLRWRLPDPRRLRVRELRDHLWLRVLDVAVALGSRTYDVDGTLVLELTDAFRPANGGRWRLDGGPDGATCSRTDRTADVQLDAADLGALFLGGVPPSTLAAAGRVRGLTDDAVARMDRMFVVHPAPWCTTHF